MHKINLKCFSKIHAKLYAVLFRVCMECPVHLIPKYADLQLAYSAYRYKDNVSSILSMARSKSMNCFSCFF